MTRTTTPSAQAPEIDWSAPWLQALRAVGERVHGRWRAGASVAEALNAERHGLEVGLTVVVDGRDPCPDGVRHPSHLGPLGSARDPRDPAHAGERPDHRDVTAHGGHPPRWPELAAGPLRFVPQHDLPPGRAYETHIAQMAGVPTRDNLHDFFNGLVWLHQPALKRCLNELQAAALARHGVGARRGAWRDRLTLFDENAAWWAAPPVLADALRRRDWHGLFLRHRTDWPGAPPVVFGHALLEKLCRPRKAITAHVWLVPPGVPSPTAWLEARLAIDPEREPVADGDASPTSRSDLHPHPHPHRELDRRAHAAPAQTAHTIAHTHTVPADTRPLPLPVLGVPGWWPANEAPGFYDDPAVFRPANHF